MKLLDITEPGQQQEERTASIAIGIDLGTTNSLVAISYNQKPQVIAGSDGNKMLPSIVNYLENNEIKIGHHSAPMDVKQLSISSTKRLMGKSNSDLPSLSNNFIWKMTEGNMEFKVFESKSNAVLCAAEILKALKTRAEDYLLAEVTQAVITVPAHFVDAARTATKDAAQLAGLKVLRLINEPTAAAFAYGLDAEEEGITMVYDLGGGTFDVSILNLQRGVFQVLATGGDSNLGGDDFDTELALYFCKQFKQGDRELLASLMPIAKQAKETLSHQFIFEAVFNQIQYKISRADFEHLIEDKIEHTIQLMQKTMRDANVTIDQVKEIVLVGGATRIPLIKQKIQQLLGKEPLQSINPDEIVALGAALQAENLTKGADTLLIDVNPLSLGLETSHGLIEKIIHRNTPIPISASKEFTTSHDGQTGMQFHIVQGERELVADCRSLAFFELALHPQKAGSSRIKVTFALDADGLLTVTAEDSATKATKEVVVKASYGLDPEQIEQMLIDSYKNAEADINKRLLLEAGIAAEQVLATIKTAIERDSELLRKEAKETLDSKINELKQLLSMENREDIKTATASLANLAEEFMVNRMNKYLTANTKGVEIDELEKILENSK